MEKLIKKENISLDQMNLEQMDVYWEQAKEIYNSEKK